jgi:Ca-activated chloride channel family protein
MRSVARLKLPSLWLATALLLLLSELPLFAQFKPANPELPSRQGPTFSANVRLVRLLASVYDANGATIGDLNRTDFQVFDRGVPQALTTFERNTSVPLSVAILVDTSGSTIMDLHFEADSVLRFIPTLLNAGNPQDTFALFSFNWRTNVESDFGRNYKRAEKAVRALKNDGGTSLYDAIYLASGTLQDRDGRHVMVIITDGGDTTSYKHFEDALGAAQRADVLIYPIVVVPIANDPGRNVGGEHALTTLSASTGGRIFFPESYENLDQAFASILRDLRTQYLLEYSPANVPEQRGLFHSITVQVRRPGARIRTRTGYYQP